MPFIIQNSATKAIITTKRADEKFLVTFTVESARKFSTAKGAEVVVKAVNKFYGKSLPWFVAQI